MTEKDVEFLLSGGSKNKQPALSLGGGISQTPIQKSFNNLFDDVTREQTFTGAVDYRCIYIKLVSTTERLKNASIFLRKAADVGAEMSVGLSLTNDVQVITVPGSPVGGSFRLSFKEKSSRGIKTVETRDIVWVPDAAFMAQRIAALVNSLGNLSGVTCIGQRTAGSYDFILTFNGTASGRSQELLQVIDDHGLRPTISRIESGGPINRVAPEIGMSNNPPNEVTFISSARREAIKIGTMLPGDFLAVWLKREVFPGIVSVHPDRFGIKIIGEPDVLSVNLHFKD